MAVKGSLSVPIAGCLLIILVVVPGSVRGQVAHTHDPAAGQAVTIAREEPVFEELQSSGKKCWIGDSLYFVYKFTEKPKLGTAILRVQLFDADRKKLARLGITGSSGMPSMKGSHDTGDVAFKLSKKGDYLLPIGIVMPGEWEVKLVFYDGERVIYRGRFRFDV